MESRVLFAGTWTAVAHGAPDGVGTMNLLPDGSVIVAGAAGNDWLRLAPDIHGSYINGKWTTLASAQDTRLYDATQVLPSGNLFVAGGEYGTGASTGAVYTPITNSWTELPANNFGAIDDSESILLDDGAVLIAPVQPSQNGYTIIYNPAPSAAASPWSQGPKLYRGGNADEQGFVKLADGSVITSDGNFTSERYIPANYPGAGAAANSWINDGTVPVALWDGLGEIGPGLQMADGRVIYLGSTGATAIYTPSGSLAPGTWTAGPSLPNGFGADDAPAAILPDGSILFTAGAPASYNGPTSFFIYTPSPGLGSFSQISGPVSIPNAPFLSRMLELPDGSALYSDGGSTVYEYNAGVAPPANAVPVINSLTPLSSGKIMLSGTGLNGISAGASYGDDAQMDTNYPIVRLTAADGNSIYYATTFDWSSSSTYTTNVAETTDFTLPLGIPAGTYSVNVVANGIQSAPAPLTISFNGSSIAPTITQPATADASPVTGVSANLSVLGAGNGGKPNLTYTWTTASAPANTPLPSFSINGTSVAKATSATFYSAGTYNFVVFVTDSGGLSTSSAVSVTVNQTESKLQISPASASVNPGGSTTFAAIALDQFALAMTTQPAIRWSILSGFGTISPLGVYTAASAGTVAIVQASDGILTATATASVVSSPWNQTDVGAPMLPGSGYDSGGVFDLSASGADIGGITDQFHFVYQKLSGNGAITALVPGLVSANSQAKAGVMIRNSLAANDMFAMMAVTTGNGTNLYYRTATGGPAQNSAVVPGLIAPYWVRIVRIGNTFTGYRSPDGTHWTTVGSVTIGMGSVVYLGMAMCSHVTTALGTATMSHVVVNQPSVALPASAGAGPVTGTSVNLSTLAADPAGESGITYTWFAATGAPGGAVAFSGAANGSNAAKNITAMFNVAGTYSFFVVMNDGLLSTVSTLSVTVNQTATTILVAPTPAPIAFGSTQSFSAFALDQFNAPMASQPAITWSATGSGNTMDGSGDLTAGAVAGTYTAIA
ncbi:MAG TPA: hypothetical protein VFC46_17055, partial [Humisphaera sp.]|nr:hypothetical protein [Humisphaera sp.]